MRYLEPPASLVWISVRLLGECNYYLPLGKVCCVIRYNMKYFVCIISSTVGKPKFEINYYSLFI